MADNVYNVCSEPSDVEQCSNNDFCLNYYLHMMLTHCTSKFFIHTEFLLNVNIVFSCCRTKRFLTNDEP